MPEIEFLSNDPPAAIGPVAQPQLVFDRLTAVRLIPALVALGGAALATRATFSWIYAIVEASDVIRFTSTDPGGSQRNTTVHTGIDGWGRTHSSGLDSVTAGHGPQYGIVLVVCAALLVMSAVAFAVSATWRYVPRAGRFLRVGQSLLIAAAGGSAAMSASFYLSYSAVRSQFRSSLSSDPLGSQISVQLGHAWLIAALAAFVALLALAASAALARLGSNRHDLTDHGSQPPQNLPVYVS